jgi:flagellar biosynthetic protein FliQ
VTEQFAIDVAQNAFMIALQIGGPFLAASLAVGMLVSVFQAVTQIQEMTLTFVPKILVTVLAMVFFGPWMLRLLIGYTVKLYSQLPFLAQ